MEVRLAYKKLHIFSVYNLMRQIYTHKTIPTVYATNISITSTHSMYYYYYPVIRTLNVRRTLLASFSSYFFLSMMV